MFKENPNWDWDTDVAVGIFTRYILYKPSMTFSYMYLSNELNRELTERVCAKAHVLYTVKHFKWKHANDINYSFSHFGENINHLSWKTKWKKDNNFRFLCSKRDWCFLLYNIKSSFLIMLKYINIIVHIWFISTWFYVHEWTLLHIYFDLCILFIYVHILNLCLPHTLSCVFIRFESKHIHITSI